MFNTLVVCCLGSKLKSLRVLGLCVVMLLYMAPHEPFVWVFFVVMLPYMAPHEPFVWVFFFFFAWKKLEEH